MNIELADILINKELGLPGDYPNYAMEAFEYGECDGLAACGFFSEVDSCLAFWNSKGCIPAITYLKSSKNHIAGNEIKLCLSLARKITESTIKAADYLVTEDLISYKFENIFIDSNKNVRLLPGNNTESFLICLCDFLCDCYQHVPECNGDIIAKKLADKNEEGTMSLQDILAFLSAWETEL